MTFPIYLDNQATTPCDSRVVEKMLPYFTVDFGNSSSVSHVYGQRALAAVNEAQEQVAALIGADDPKSIFFTSGATESNNIAVKSVMFAAGFNCHLITSAAEHKAILDPVEFLASKGYDVEILAVNEFGQVNPLHVAATIKNNTRMVSVIFANNEVGSLNDIKAIAKICKERNVLFHTDATQALGRVPIDCAKSGIDMLSLSGHKIYGPKGIGAIYIRKRARGLKLEPLQHGGGHQNKIRSGTMPVALIVGLGEACRIAKQDFVKDNELAVKIADVMKRGFLSNLEGVHFNGHPDQRIPTNLHLSIPGVNSDALLHLLRESVAISTGAACTTAAPEPSHVLLAMSKTVAEVKTSIRIGIGRFTEMNDAEKALDLISRAANSLRQIAR